MTRPKVGLLLLTAEWFSQIGASQGVFQGLSHLLDVDAANIEQALGVYLEVVNPGVLATRAQVSEAIERFEREGIDALVACQITWGEDRLILDAVEKLPQTPLLLWCYAPFRRLPVPMTMRDLFRASGPVGAVQASGPLKRRKRVFKYPWAKLGFQHVQAVRSVLAEDLKPVTVNRYLSALGGVLNAAWQLGQVTSEGVLKGLHPYCRMSCQPLEHQANHRCIDH